MLSIRTHSFEPQSLRQELTCGVEFGKDIVLRKDRDLSMALDELECNLRRRTSGMEVVTGGGFGCQDSAFDGAEKAGQTETPEKSKRNEESEAVVISGAAGASTVSDSPARMFADQCMKPSTSDEFTGEAKRRLEFMLLEAETYMQEGLTRYPPLTHLLPCQCVRSLTVRWTSGGKGT